MQIWDREPQKESHFYNVGNVHNNNISKHLCNAGNVLVLCIIIKKQPSTKKMKITKKAKSLDTRKNLVQDAELLNQQ